MTNDTRRHLVLVGLMGAGKTTVGERCAARLDRPFVDTDDLVETLAGRSVAELFTESEATFRTFERDAIADACASLTPLVIACGGGAVLDPTSRRRLRETGFVVWLRADPPVLADRVRRDGVDRPLLTDAGTLPTLARLADTRAPSYEATADVAVTTEGRTPDAVATSVLEELDRCAV